MAGISLDQFKRQASFFLREKLKSARLALTDVTQIELLAEEATNDDPWGPTTQTMSRISEATFVVDDYLRVVRILHSRLVNSDKKHWRGTFKTLSLLEYLLTHGPESFGPEFETEVDILTCLTHYKYQDDHGFDRGEGVCKKAARILDLLTHDDLLKQERSNARRISRGISGFGNLPSNLSTLSALRRSISDSSDWGKYKDKSDEERDNLLAEVEHENQEVDSRALSKSLTFPESFTGSTTVNKEDGLEYDMHTNQIQKDNEWKAFEDDAVGAPLALSPGSMNKTDEEQPESEDSVYHSFMEYDENMAKESLICHDDENDSFLIGR